MPIPIVTIPKQGPIATRPRRESLYDTEAYPGATAIVAKKSLYVNATAFAQSAVSLAKIKGRDHNMDGANGLLPKGTMFHWYGWRMKWRPLGTVLSGIGNGTIIPWFDVRRRIKDSCWTTFYFGSSALYLQLQVWQVPEGAGIPDCQHNQSATTYVGNSQDVDRLNVYDITLNGVPTEIGELEAYSVDIEANGVTPTPVIDTFVTSQLVGMLFKGIQG